MLTMKMNIVSKWLNTQIKHWIINTEKEMKRKKKYAYDDDDDVDDAKVVRRKKMIRNVH